jgi:nicotinamide-nucleotide amidase
VPLPNPIGTAPGVVIRESGTTMFSLPGVPSEMKAIFRDSIMPFLESLSSSRPSELQFKIAGIIESALAPILDKARRMYPGLYFKSHPRGKETGVRPLILLHIYSTEPGSANKVAEAAEYIVRRVSGLRK